MKKQFFTLIIIVLAATFAKTTFAAGTYLLPLVNESYNYTVDGLTIGDGWDYDVTLTTENYGGVGAASAYSINSGETGAALAAVTQTANITWLAPGAYRVWIRIEDKTGGTCFNYKFITITVAYTPEFSILALGEASNSATQDVTGYGSGATQLLCAVPITPNYEAGGGYSLGTTYVYFKVIRTVTPAYNRAWTFTTSSASVGVTAWAYSTDGVTFATEALGVKAVPSGTNTVYYRATVTNAIAQHDVVLSMGDNNTNSSATDTGAGAVADATFTDVVATVQVDDIPSIGSFSTN